jgi:hypothetical protein
MIGTAVATRRVFPSLMRGCKVLRGTADHYSVIRTLALAAILATTAAAHRSAARSERRDQSQAQRHTTKAPARSSAARREFQRLHPCPSTGKPIGACPGYVVDHIVPLKRGGLDDPSNMQWQTIAEAKAKDRIE